MKKRRIQEESRETRKVQPRYAKSIQSLFNFGYLNERLIAQEEEEEPINIGQQLTLVNSTTILSAVASVALISNDGLFSTWSIWIIVCIAVVLGVVYRTSIISIVMVVCVPR